jgi:hypothetical protein
MQLPVLVLNLLPLPTRVGEGVKFSVVSNHVCIMVYDLKTPYINRLTTPPTLITDIANKYAA